MKAILRACLVLGLTASWHLASAQKGQQKPNIIIILADDMGYSDLGCYGSEIPTPNIDALGAQGIKLSQFYNTARCCPSRASLLTGLHPHQTGVGHMAEELENPTASDWGIDGYKGYLNKNCVTIAEVLKQSGYHTYMTGKWHVGMATPDRWPLQRGFEQFTGILPGGSSHLKPFPLRGIVYGNNPPVYDAPKGYYDTDFYTDNAIKFINEQKDTKPFFLYLAHTAPHWPLQAKQADIDKFMHKYDIGWDSVRQERWRKQLAMGLVKKEWGLSKQDMRPWNELTAQEKKDVSYRMAIYAAQVYCLDYNVGKLVKSLKDSGKLKNTFIMFLSDNGAAAEPGLELGGKPMSEVNNPDKFWAVSYGKGWANVSNTPFRRYKIETYEGGMSAPFIAYWPGVIKSQAGKFNSTPHYLIDIMPTVLDIAGAKYPKVYNGNTIYPNQGISMKPLFLNGKGEQHDYMYWEHEDNCAIRHGKWKGVKRLDAKQWELYDLDSDRTEQFNVAAQHADIVKDLDAHWIAWANSHNVLPKGNRKQVYKN
ncbi:MAG: arylsulfatase [Sphingobacteriaceae bacterium]|jgi:arylsulfatase|nr:arylsulfatase [Sphingobacteriaceae bacterium]